MKNLIIKDTKLTKNIVIRENEKLYLKKTKRNIIIERGATLNAMALIEVRDIHVGEGSELNAPLLCRVRNLHVGRDAIMNVPSLKEMQFVDVQEEAKLTLPSVNKIWGTNMLYGGSLNAPLLVESSKIYVGKKASLNAPALVKIGEIKIDLGGGLIISPNAKISGYIEDRENSFSHPNILKTIFLPTTSRGYEYQAGGSVTTEGIYIRMGCYVRSLQDWEGDFWNNPFYPNDKSRRSNNRLKTFQKIKNYLLK